MQTVECVVVGAGVVGLAIACRLALLGDAEVRGAIIVAHSRVVGGALCKDGVNLRVAADGGTETTS